MSFTDGVADSAWVSSSWLVGLPAESFIPSNFCKVLRLFSSSYDARIIALFYLAWLRRFGPEQFTAAFHLSLWRLLVRLGYHFWYFAVVDSFRLQTYLSALSIQLQTDSCWRHHAFPALHRRTLRPLALLSLEIDSFFHQRHESQIEGKSKSSAPSSTTVLRIRLTFLLHQVIVQLEQLMSAIFQIGKPSIFACSFRTFRASSSWWTLIWNTGRSFWEG